MKQLTLNFGQPQVSQLVKGQIYFSESMGCALEVINLKFTGNDDNCEPHILMNVINGCWDFNLYPETGECYHYPKEERVRRKERSARKEQETIDKLTPESTIVSEDYLIFLDRMSNRYFVDRTWIVDDIEDFGNRDRDQYYVNTHSRTERLVNHNNF
jgi:hypothetical protein